MVYQKLLAYFRYIPGGIGQACRSTKVPSDTQDGWRYRKKEKERQGHHICEQLPRNHSSQYSQLCMRLNS